MEETDFFIKEVSKDKELRQICKICYQELFDKYQEYQDELLHDTLKVLLSIPTYFIDHFSDLLILAMKKSLQIGLTEPCVAYAGIISI